jgi:hypothetical protein
MGENRMKSRLAVIVSVLALVFSGTASAQLKDGAIAIDAVESVITVEDVDREARVVTIRGPEGRLATITVPPEAQNLDQVYPGARFRVRYVESVAIAITKGGGTSSSASRSVMLAPKGDIPGGMVMNVRQIAGVVETIDYGSRRVSVRGPAGNLLVVTAGEDVQHLDQIETGDSISVEYTEALAMRMIEE